MTTGPTENGDMQPGDFVTVDLAEFHEVASPPTESDHRVIVKTEPVVIAMYEDVWYRPFRGRLDAYGREVKVYAILKHGDIKLIYPLKGDAGR